MRAWVALHKKALVVFLFFYLLIAVATLQQRYRLVWQYDRSVDFSIALLDKGDKKLLKDNYYAFVFHFAGDQREGRHFVKRAACLEGEHLMRTGDDFSCGQQHLVTALPVDSKGKSLPGFHYSGIIPAGKVFVVGDQLTSYDSRYWGFVDRQWLIGRVHKII